MGEYSKRVGEVGEKVVHELLSLIGWTDIMTNEDIESVDPEFRKRTNGLDGYYHYRNPMISQTITNVLYSCKYSSSPYLSGNSLITKFKENYTDLAKAIESFKKSKVMQEIQQTHENIDTYFDRGVIFMLNNSLDEDPDIITKLSKIELSTNVEHDGIFLVDNNRAKFLYTSIKYAKGKYPDYDIDFMYIINNLNLNDSNPRNGKIMPVEYINSSILPLRVCKDKETIIMLFTIDKFSAEDLMKYFGLAKKIGNNAQGSTIICFPDYLETEHRTSVDRLKRSFDDSSFTKNLSVENFANPLFK